MKIGLCALAVHIVYATPPSSIESHLVSPPSHVRAIRKKTAYKDIKKWLRHRRDCMSSEVLFIEALHLQQGRHLASMMPALGRARALRRGVARSRIDQENADQISDILQRVADLASRMQEVEQKMHKYTFCLEKLEESRK